ncbi:MAG: replication initiator protein [Microvirus sp.]|nr:MAG: replication initiator protein [Microvirus sp.]
MTCYSPIPAWKSRDLADTNAITKKTKLVFKSELGLKTSALEIPCGQCIGCRLDRARSWAIRAMHEASLHDDNCFLTLTYSNEQPNNSLNKRDITLFMKNLRKQNPDKIIRYFQCGEYGDASNRPHHHVLLFNHKFEDARYFTSKKQYKLYVSRTLSDLWPHGMHSIGELNFDTACYTARYILKKTTGKNAKEHYGDRLPEYTTMSRRPGIATDWFKRFFRDIYNHDKCVISHNFIARPPIFYDRMYDNLQPDHFKLLKKNRRANALNNPENTDDRRNIKRKITLIKQERISRPFENGTSLNVTSPITNNTDTQVSE